MDVQFCILVIFRDGTAVVLANSADADKYQSRSDVERVEFRPLNGLTFSYPERSAHHVPVNFLDSIPGSVVIHNAE